MSGCVCWKQANCGGSCVSPLLSPVVAILCYLSSVSSDGGQSCSQILNPLDRKSLALSRTARRRCNCRSSMAEFAITGFAWWIERLRLSFVSGLTFSLVSEPSKKPGGRCSSDERAVYLSVSYPVPPSDCCLSLSRRRRVRVKPSFIVLPRNCTSKRRQ